jgi:hypothetical protein
MRKSNPSIDYDHSHNLHGTSGPRAAIPILFGESIPASLLDVGCGVGTWLRAAIDFGIPECLGVEGVDVPVNELLVPRESVKQQDLTRSWSLNKQFDAVLCFEVAEHLDSSSAGVLIGCLVKHSDWIYFSAACPGQAGQHHVNCQWPAYWQKLFNEQGYVCSDDIRWRLWENPVLEPWYRQNIFCARRDSANAGTEPRIRAVIHPQMIDSVFEQERFQAHVAQIEDGIMRTTWYAKALVSAVAGKVRRRL